jgi:hypothetical protein
MTSIIELQVTLDGVKGDACPARRRSRPPDRPADPARAVAMVSRLLADGGGPLYRADSRDDLDAIIERASQALIS